MTLLDEKTGIVIEYRLKYPETTMNELAEIISLETDYKITKSGINHHFRKIKELVEKGNSMVCQGNALVSKGNSMISKGKTLVSEGNKMSSSANIHRDNAKQLDKLATQIMHMTTQLGVRKGEKEKEKSV